MFIHLGRKASVHIRKVGAFLTFLTVVMLPLSFSALGQQSTARVREDVTPSLFERDLSEPSEAASTVEVWVEGSPVRVVEDLKEASGADTAAVVAETSVARAASAETLAPIAGIAFDGIAATGSLPPDTVGDVGPSHYIQAVNTALSIYDKSGTLLAGPLPINSLWSGFGGACQTNNNGDPIVRYDHLADRWLISQFAIPGGAQGFHECIAVSRSGDPVAGGWFLYDFPTIDTTTNNPVFPDYPKIGVWPDAYYMGSQRGFPGGGLDVWAFERTRMLAGQPARAVQFAVPAPSLFLMPSDLDGPAPPPGTPNHFVRQVDGQRFGGNDRLEVFEFHVDWSNPAASTFTQLGDLNTQPFDSVLCSTDLLGACIPQPGTSQLLETLTVWPMWRLQFRNFGSYEAMVINHTVDANGSDLAGIRWYELRRAPGGAWAIFQQGTYAPDNTHRWMGSAAMDQEGNVAVGYSVSSGTVFPGVRAATREIGDPPGQLPQPELTLVTGGGSQTHSARRYGNYSSLDVDPVDDCTFWYTTEYYSSTSQAGWRTRVATFRMPNCGTPPGVTLGLSLRPPANSRIRHQRTALLTAAVTQNGSPVSGQSVTFTSLDPTLASVSPSSAVTDASGLATATVRGEYQGRPDRTTEIQVTAGVATKNQPVKVPDFPATGIWILLSAYAVGWGFRRRTQVGTRCE